MSARVISSPPADRDIETSSKVPLPRPRLSTLPLRELARKIARRPSSDLRHIAAESWEIAPKENRVTPPAFFLDGQLERIEAWALTPGNAADQMIGGTVVEHSATRAYLIKNAYLIDGVLYHRNFADHLHPRSSRIPKLRVRDEIDRGAIYSTASGNRWFGQWLMDDVLSYPLAVAEGVPVSTDQPISEHARSYEKMLGMKPERAGATHLKEAIVFEDVGQNQNKSARFKAVRSLLRSQIQSEPHPGVFLLRGTDGDRRVLRNEAEVANALQNRFGLKVIDPLKCSLEEILTASLGAQLAVGVEGSQLLHGILGLAIDENEKSGLLTIQPPDRFCPNLKHVMDREGGRFGFVVCAHDEQDYRCDVSEVERTVERMLL